jgi:hypothetical protein
MLLMHANELALPAAGLTEETCYHLPLARTRATHTQPIERECAPGALSAHALGVAGELDVQACAKWRRCSV